MTKRKSTPKVDFNSWLTGEESSPTSAESPPPATTTPPVQKKKASVKTVKKEKPKVIKKEKPLLMSDASGGKIKATFHIDTTTAENLDAIQYRLKRLTGLRGHAISKSKILDTIMQLLHDELEAEGQYSRLCLAIQAKSAEKQ